MFQSWPGLTSKLVSKYLPNSVATVQVHLNQARKNTRSTQVTITIYPINTETHLVFSTVANAGKVYSDQTGRFPVTSSKGVNYSFNYYHTIPTQFSHITSIVEQEEASYSHT